MSALGRMYAAAFSAVAFTAANDAFELNAPSDACVVVHALYLSQGTELGDAAEEQLLVQIQKGATSSGSGGAAITPVPRCFGDAAFGGTVERVNTTQASGGTIVTHHSAYWNIRIPFELIFTPEIRMVLSPSERMTVLLPAPTDSVTLGGTLIFSEVGG
jgi:hypothetical protein